MEDVYVALGSAFLGGCLTLLGSLLSARNTRLLEEKKFTLQRASEQRDKQIEAAREVTGILNVFANDAYRAVLPNVVAIVQSPQSITPDGLEYRQEFARHKALLPRDLALLAEEAWKAIRELRRQLREVAARTIDLEAFARGAGAKEISNYLVAAQADPGVEKAAKDTVVALEDFELKVETFTTAE